MSSMNSFPVLNEPLFHLNDHVESRYLGGWRYYKAVITQVHTDRKVYEVRYDDGINESEVPEDMIRQPDPSQEKEATAFKVGDQVEARYKRQEQFLPGIISQCHPFEHYDVAYDVGEKETQVDGQYIRLRQQSIATTPTKHETKGKYKEGDKVEVQYKRGHHFFSGRISRCHLDGTYDIEYDDGDKEQEVLPEHIRFPTVGSITNPSKDHCVLLRLLGWTWNSNVLQSQNLNRDQIQVEWKVFSQEGTVLASGKSSEESAQWRRHCYFIEENKTVLQSSTLLFSILKGQGYYPVHGILNRISSATGNSNDNIYQVPLFHQSHLIGHLHFQAHTYI